LVLLVYRARFLDVRYFFVVVPFVWLLAARTLASLTTQGTLARGVAVALLAVSVAANLARLNAPLRVGRGHYKDAITTLQDAIRLKPTEALPHKLLGLAYLVVDEPQQALEQYTILQSLDVTMADYLNHAILSPNKPTFGVASGKLVSVPQADYPEAARSKGISGKVTVEVTINEQGRVTSARAISGPAELGGAAEAAALKARFAPTKLSGTTVSVNGVITFNFVPH
jgi:TonB family protein